MSKPKHYDPKNYRVTNTKKWGQIKELKGTVKILNARFYSNLAPQEDPDEITEADAIERTSLIGIQFQMPKGKKEWVTVPVPQVFSQMLYDIVNILTEDAIDEICCQMLEEEFGDEYENIYDELCDEVDEEFGTNEDDPECIWDDAVCGTDAIAGILTGSLSCYIMEKYGQYLSSQAMSNCIHAINDIIMNVLTSIAEPIVKELVEEAIENMDKKGTIEKKPGPAPIIDITGKVKTCAKPEKEE